MLLVTQERQRQIVARRCDRAARAGVREGAPVAQARGLFDDPSLLRIEAHDPAADRAALKRLAVWAERLAPTVAIDEAQDEPDTLLLDVTGCAPVWGGEDRLARAATESLRELGLRARVAIAPTFGCAWAAAHFGGENPSIVPAGGAHAALTPLPVAALRLDTDVIRHLGEVGIERVGELLDLPRATLPARFGDGLVLRIDQALGRAIEVVRPIREVAPPDVKQVFDGPTPNAEAVGLSVRGLLELLCERLRTRESGAWSVEVELMRSDLAPERLAVTLGHPARDPRRLWALLAPKLERAHLGFGVEGVRVRAISVGPLRHEQGACIDDDLCPHEPDAAVDELLDTLVNRLGVDRVLRAEIVESHRPERAFEMRRAAEPREKRAPAISPADRPGLLFDRPVPAEVVALTPDGPVHRVRWRGVEEEVGVCIGPERLGGEWWRSRGATRDYFKVRTAGGAWLWLARAVESGRWFVHGVWG